MTALARFVHRLHWCCRLLPCFFGVGFVSVACLAETANAQQVRIWPAPAVLPKQAEFRSLALATTPLAAPLADTFLLHSRATATKVIYLDFDGHLTTGTQWNSGGNTITTSPYSVDANAAFSNTELANVQDIWQGVAEYFSPFDVDVTTEEPPLADLINAGSGDTRWGIRVAIGPTSPDFAGAIGIALLTSFNFNSDTPTFVMPEKTGYDSAFIALVTAHEVGHTLGLNHDGYPANAYYPGHGTGTMSWGPIMGAADTRNVLQWSRGEYSTANNQEDDLTIITTQNGFGFRPDDHASSQTSAVKIRGTRGATAFNVDQSGVIERRTDSDWFKIVANAGTLDFTASGLAAKSMLDIQMDLYSDKGALLTSSNPTTAKTASIRRTVVTGIYYLKIDGVGLGDVLGTGYSDYGSLGQYRITGTFLDGTGTLSASKVTATFSSNTLTILGDDGNNSVSVVRSGENLKVEGGTGTTINGKTSDVFALGTTDPISLNVDLKSGADILSLDSVALLNAKFEMGPGADNLTIKNSPASVMTINADTSAANVAGADSVLLQSSNISTSLTCNLGPFNDTFSLSASTVKSLTLLMGTGNDTATLAYSSLTSLNVDGGDGTDTLVRTTSTVTNTPTITSVP